MYVLEQNPCCSVPSERIRYALEQNATYILFIIFLNRRHYPATNILRWKGGRPIETGNIGNKDFADNIRRI